MKKTLLGIAFAALFFAGCPHDGGSGGNGGGETTEDGTFVKFKNNEVFPVEVYSDSGRASFVASVPAEGESATVAWQPGEAGFYLKYTVNADGVSFPYVPPAAGGYLYTRVDEGKTRSITLPMLEETLSSAELNRSFTSDVYVKVQNDSAATLQFLKSSTVLKPENSQYSTVIAGESVTYKTNAGSTAEYQFRKNGVTDMGLPAALTEFEAGHLYSLKFENSGVSLIVDIPLTISQIFASFLAAPQNLTASAFNSNIITLAWDAVDGAAGYNVYRSDSAEGIYVKVTSSPVTGTSYLDTGLSAETTYYYKVSAANAGGAGSVMSTAVAVTTPMNTPTGLQAEGLSFDRVSLTWNAVSTGAQYDIYTAGNSGGPWTKIASVSETAYTHTGLSAGTTYYYKVKARRGTNYSADSAEASAVTLSSGMFVQNGGMVSGVAEPFSIANALLWLKTNAQANTAYTIVINANETLAPQTLSYANLNNKSGVSITLTGSRSERTVQLDSNGSLFTVESGVTLTLGENVTLVGRASNSAPLVHIGGTLVMEDGAKVMGNNTTGYAGGVYVYPTGTFTMNGGKIADNTATYSGGGVFVNSGTFTMNGGEISSNTASRCGGGVFIDDDDGSGTFTMTGGEISGNTVTSSDAAGGGVCVYSGTFTMNGGEISGNSASYEGGGVFVYSGTFTMSGGEISGNTAICGGGVYVYISGTFTMNGGEISGNSASYEGGGVYVFSGTSTMNGGTFKKRPASGSSTSGVIYGYTTGDAKSNWAGERGHAVFEYVTHISYRYRNTTAGESVSLDSTKSGAAGGWE
jgi:hypothetical protein